jgi:hypothetical protein
VVQQHKNYGPLLKDYGFDKVVNNIKVLLEQRIFESELKAKIAFPELFQLSPVHDVQRTVLDNPLIRRFPALIRHVLRILGDVKDESII